MAVQLKGQKLNNIEHGKTHCVVILGRVSQRLQGLIEDYCEHHECGSAALLDEKELSNFALQDSPTVVFCAAPAGRPVSAACDPMSLADCRSEPFARILVCEAATISMAVAAMQHGYYSVMDSAPEMDSAPGVEGFEQLMVSAFEFSEKKLQAEKQRRRIIEILDRMTEGELSVLKSVVDGHLNKRIAKRLEISERTVEARRKRIFEKTETTSVAMLVRAIVESIGIDELYRRCEVQPKHLPAPHLHLGGASSTAKSVPLSQQRGC